MSKTPNKRLKVALIQHSCNNNRDTNLTSTIRGIRSAAKQDANLIVLQELHTGCYFCQEENEKNFDRAESIPGPTTEQLGKLSRELNVVIVSSIFEIRAPGMYHNTAVVLEIDGSIAGKYRKMHIPDDPGFQEKFYFTPGDLGFTPIETSVGNLGVLICWDQWFPEAARVMTLAGADILLYPTAIGWDPADNKMEKNRQLDAWKTVQRAHAICNGLPVICCNRTGFETAPSATPNEQASSEKGIQFWGNSFIAGQQGEILAQASANDNEVLVTEINLGRTDKIRRIWPYLRDRRIDAYQQINERFIKN